jgi:GntR family transcriptional regulator/MocR family aminotransferase
MMNMTTSDTEQFTSLADGFALSIDRTLAETLGSQLRRGLLELIRNCALRPGVRLPSTRALATHLRISRPLVVETYAQLAAEGYLSLRRGARPVVAGEVPAPPSNGETLAEAEPIRFDLRPAMPDVSMFPRRLWLRALRSVLASLPASELGYGDLRGSPVLRRALADYLGRVRGAIVDPACVFVTSGFAEGRALACAALRAKGVCYLAVEDPSYSDWVSVDKAGLHRVPVPVDEDGLDVAHLATLAAEAVFVTPAHQFPIGGVLSPVRRRELVRWLRERSAFALEDDYDAEFRYDHAPVGALQGLAPDRVIYAGTASKTLAPALRLGWLVVPPDLVDTMTAELRRWSEGPPRIDQDALADLIASGAYDRHLRKMRRFYRDRRDHLLSCLASALPDLATEGAAAGLHVTLRLPLRIDAAGEAHIVAYLRRHGVATEGLGRYSTTCAGPRRLFLGYGRIADSGIEPSVRILAEAVREAAVQDP